MRAIVVAGTCSGAGKSSIALGLMAAYARRGLRVHPFKIGPDFADPMHHKAATGNDSFNLDSWMMNRDVNLACFMRCAASTDVAIVEGVMGMFDGRDGKSESGSTAEMAKILGAPVLLVIDTRGLARSAAALIQGYTTFDPEVSFAGIIFNKLASSAHKSWLTEAVSTIDSSIRVLGGIPIVEGLHLVEDDFSSTLIDAEPAVPASYIQVFANLVEHHVDLDGLLDAAGVWKPKSGTNFQYESIRPAPAYSKVRIGVARDAAFCLYYQENLSLLQDAGAELVFFSPLKDSLPTRLDAIIFGGGYPEDHLEQLSLNKKLLYAVRAFADAGGIIYGEAAGAMYLSQGIETHERKSYTMSGVFPFWTRTRVDATKQYVKVMSQDNCVLFPPHIGEIRGHMCNCSEIFWRHTDGINVCPKGFLFKYESTEMMEELEGYMQGNAMATFVRLHFGSNMTIVRVLIDRCRMDSSKAAAVAAASASAVANAGPAAAAAAGSAAARAVTAALGESREISPEPFRTMSQAGPSGVHSGTERGRDPCRRHARSLSSSPVYTRTVSDEECPDIEVDIKETTDDASRGRLARSQSEIWDTRKEDALSPHDTTENVISISDQFVSEEGRAAGKPCFLTAARKMDPFPGNYVGFNMKVIPQRIVSLFPVATELVLKLGAGNRLLGVTDACDKPVGVRMGRHIVCRSQQRSSIGKENDLTYKLDLPWLSKMKPHLIITQKVCSLCSMDSKEVTEEITRAGLQDSRLFLVDPHTLSDVWAFIMELADILGVYKEACQLINSLRLRLRRTAASVAVQHHPRLLLLQGLDPLTLGGRWIAEVEVLAGAYDGLQKPGCSSEKLHWQRITSYAPEFIILACCSSSVEQTLAEVHKLARQPGFWSVPAVETRQIYICEGSYFSQPGLRVVDGMELLAHILHPHRVSAPSGSAILKLSLKPGQKCRPEELHRHFVVK